MIVECFESKFDIPDLLIDKFTKDFDGLPGSGNYESIAMLRNAIWEVIDVVAEEPDIIEDEEYLHDFIRALAMKKAMENNGIYLDS